MKTPLLVVEIILLIAITTLFFGTNAFANNETIIPQADSNMTYKISFDSGTKDWNPVSNVLVISNNNTLMQFAANGTQLPSLYAGNIVIDFPRFNPDGTKIVFLNNYPGSEPADLFVLDLQNNHLSRLTHDAHAFEAVWTPDNNIVYSQMKPDSSFEILKLDTKNSATSVILDSLYTLGGFDISPDGTKIVISQNYTGQGCSRSYYSSCHDHLFIYDLDSNKQNFTEIAKTDTEKFNPRWALDGSFITYETSYTIDAITPDGNLDTSLIYPTSGPGYYAGAVLNRDQTIIAYDKGYGGIPYDETFNPLNGGLYFTFTKKCSSDSCPTHVKSLPLLDPIQYGYDIYPGGGKSVTTYVDKADSTQKMATYGIDNKTLSFVLENQGKPRSLKVFFPTKTLNGNLTVMIDGKEFYPSLSKDCGTLFGPKCKGVTEVENFGEWTMVKAIDADTSKDSSTINIVGTNAIPEFPFAVLILLISITLLTIFYRIQNRK